MKTRFTLFLIIMLAAIGMTQAQPVSYLWSNGATTPEIVVNPSHTTTYYCTIFQGSVQYKDSITVVVEPALTATISSITSTTFCAGGSVVLNTDTSSGLTYSWKLNGIAINGATSASYTASIAGAYSVTVTNTSNCSATSSATQVTVNEAPQTPNITAGGPTSFCSGGSVSLSAPSGLNYLWSNGSTNQSITVNSSGSYSVQTISGTCTSAVSQATQVTVNQAPQTPNITAGGPTSFCSGGSVTLNAPAGLSYIWSNGSTNQSITVSSTGSYSVQTISGTCTSAVSQATQVTVNQAPQTPNITAGGPTSFCSGGSVSLSAPAGFTYLWSNGSTNQSITVNSTGSYSVQTISGTCTSAVSQATQVTVNQAPQTPNITAGGPTSFCSGGSVTLNAPAGLSYIWSNGSTNQSITVSSAGSYTLQTISGTCTSAVSQATQVTVNQAPQTPNITAGGPTSFCSGGSVSLIAPAGLNYLWSNGSTNQSITVNSTGSYSVQTISGTCTSAVSQATQVTVNQVPQTPSITAGGLTSFCTGGSVTLNAPAGLSYIWSNGSTNQSITVNSTGSYSVQTISGTCTSAVSQATQVTVNQAPQTPNITAGGPTSFCSGGSVTLNAPAGLSYIWSNGSTSQSITVSSTGSYSVQTISGTCTSAVSQATQVTVNQAPQTPNITAGGPTSFCSGGSVSLSAPAGLNYLWSNGSTNQSITVNSSGSYSVQTISGTCTSAVSQATQVTVNQAPQTPNITAGGPTSFCSGGSVTLNAPSGLNYLWSNGSTNQSITVSSSGSYSVQTISGTCTSAVSQATQVTVNQAPQTPNITAGGPTSFCSGGSVTLNAPAGLSYIWSNGSTNQSITVSSTGSYTVQTISGTCTSAVSQATQVTVNQAPEIGNIQIVNGDTLQVNSISGSTYQWYINGGIISGANLSYYVFGGQPGSFLVMAMSNNCLDSASIVITSAQSLIDRTLSIYPNPGRDIFQVRTAGLEGSLLRVTDLLGREILRKEILVAETQVELSRMPSATYFFRIEGNNFNKVLKVVKR